ncbi:DUF924 family protein [Aquicoccus porphyridii]|uniref:DUF924 family protein n=1 Tax=Aquicoccus porphyridii TaxID=1852029 RepID=UPI00319D8ECC
MIAQFARFPHRNAVLGRNDTPEEADHDTPAPLVRQSATSASPGALRPSAAPHRQRP